MLQGEREIAQYNKSLGRFILDGIPPARRGIPQIDVQFDIDSNGIVNVTAKDLGTQKEQKITIASSANMSKDDVSKAVKDAEMFAEEDRKHKEEVEIKNQADSLVYQSEKVLEDIGDKVPDSEKIPVKEQIEKLKETLKGTDSEKIKAETEKLSKLFYDLSAKLYANKAPNDAGPNSNEGPKNEGKGADNVYDADFKEVDEDKK